MCLSASMRAAYKKKTVLQQAKGKVQQDKRQRSQNTQYFVIIGIDTISRLMVS